MVDSPLTNEEILNILAFTPGRIVKTTEGLAEAQLAASVEKGQWSARDVLAHMLACSDMWGRYIERILREDHPTFTAVSPRTWIKETDYLQQGFENLLRAFTDQRADLLDVLKPLHTEDWGRTAEVREVGRTVERSAAGYAIRLANHEKRHLRQLEAIVDGLRGKV